MADSTISSGPNATPVARERDVALADEIAEYFGQIARGKPPISSYEVRCDLLDMLTKARSTLPPSAPGDWAAKARDMLSGALSGFIGGTAADKKWNRDRDALVAEYDAALSASPATGGVLTAEERAAVDFATKFLAEAGPNDAIGVKSLRVLLSIITRHIPDSSRE